MAVTLRLYTDFVCPFCFVAEESSVARLLKEFELELEWRGFELHPETPVGGARLEDLFGPRIQAMSQRMKAFAQSFGIHDMGSPERIPNTRAALALAELARDEGRLEPFRKAAMSAHWREGQDLESPQVLAALAQRAGLSEGAASRAASKPGYLERVDKARDEANQMGVTGIPTFIIGSYRVEGCQPYEVLAEIARRAGAARRG